MPRYRSKPLTLEQISMDGPAVRLRDIQAVTGFARGTLEADIRAGYLLATRRRPIPRSPYLIERDEARRYLMAMGYKVHGPVGV